MTYEEAMTFTNDCMGFDCEHCGWQNDCKDKGRAAEYEYTVRQAIGNQIPMRIKEIHCDEYICPACGVENICDNGVVYDSYCPQCGQKLE